MLSDRADFLAVSGSGGHGCVSFLRQKFRPKGGPDGGDGGRGGDITIEASRKVRDLARLKQRRKIKASNGLPGMGKRRRGKDGDDIILKVPLGTRVRIGDESDEEFRTELELNTHGESLKIAAGGRGGRGNWHYKSSVNQTPRQFEEGHPGQEVWVSLEMRLVADVGLIGKPNAGKSTLLSMLTRANPEIADYPFTTIRPNLGIWHVADTLRLVVADIPGLIEGAAQGAGLGHEFLRHIEKTEILVHVLAATDEDPAASYRAIREELAQFGHGLAEKPELIVLNKIDQVDESQIGPAVQAIEQALERTIQPISALSGEGLMDMSRSLAALWQQANVEA